MRQPLARVLLRASIVYGGLLVVRGHDRGRAPAPTPTRPPSSLVGGMVCKKSMCRTSNAREGIHHPRTGLLRVPASRPTAPSAHQLPLASVLTGCLSARPLVVAPKAVCNPQTATTCARSSRPSKGSRGSTACSTTRPLQRRRPPTTTVAVSRAARTTTSRAIFGQVTITIEHRGKQTGSRYVPSCYRHLAKNCTTRCRRSPVLAGPRRRRGGGRRAARALRRPRRTGAGRRRWCAMRGRPTRPLRCEQAGE